MHNIIHISAKVLKLILIIHTAMGTGTTIATSCARNSSTAIIAGGSAVIAVLVLLLLVAVAVIVFLLVQQRKHKYPLDYE